MQGQTTGFTLDSLLKLNTAKAFDKKTSILHYLVILAKRNDPTLLDFKDVRVITPDTIASTGTNANAVALLAAPAEGETAPVAMHTVLMLWRPRRCQWQSDS